MIDGLKQDMTFLPMVFSQNTFKHYVEAAPADLTDRADLRYFLKIEKPVAPQSPSFEVLTTLEGRETPPVPPLITSEGARFVLNDRRNGMLDGILSIPEPPYKQKNISAIATLTSPFQMTELVTGGTPVQDTENILDRDWLYKGGLSEEDFAGWGNDFFVQELKASRRFLTWQPDLKYICTGTEEYLYYLLNFSPLPTELRLRVEYTLQDGTEITETIRSISKLTANQVLCFPVGLPAQDLTDEFIATIKKFKVWISDSANARISAVRTFVVDRKYRKQTRFIIFSNSFNTYDTMRLLGEATESLEVERTIETMEFTYRERVIEVSGQRILEVSTGFYEKNMKAQLKYLQELIISRQIYQVTEKGLQALTLMTDELISGQDEKSVISRNLKFMISGEVINYSDLPVATATAARPTGWKPIQNIYLLGPDGKRSGYIKGALLQKIYTDDYSDVKPTTRKANLEGDPDYIEPIYDEEMDGYSPFLNVEYTKIGSFKRALCPGTEIPGRATIVIPAGDFGGESQQDADKLAKAQADILDTQEYANANGVCIAGPWVYDADPPADHARFRISNYPFNNNFVDKYNNAGTSNIGNGWFNPIFDPGAYRFLPGTWDIDLPTNYSTTQWRFGVYVTQNTGTCRVRIYVDAILVHTETFAASTSYKAVMVANGLITSETKVYIMIDYV